MARVDEVSEALLRAAGDVLAAEGPGALTVRRIAHEAGISTINVYSRFGGKEGLLEQLYLEGFRRLADAMNAVPTTDDPLGDLLLCGLAYRQFALENTTYYAVMFDRAVPEFEPSPDTQVAATATLELLAAMVQRVVEAGEFAPVDGLHTAATIWAACHGAMSLELKAVGPPQVDWEQVYQQMMVVVARGLSSGRRDDE
jgi:AcrR family transcriptional regulator